MLDQLKQYNLINSLNLILTSDHGMVNTSNEKVILLNKYVDTSLFSAYGGVVNKNLFLKNCLYFIILILFQFFDNLF